MPVFLAIICLFLRLSNKLCSYLLTNYVKVHKPNQSLTVMIGHAVLYSFIDESVNWMCCCFAAHGTEQTGKSDLVLAGQYYQHLSNWMKARVYPKKFLDLSLRTFRGAKGIRKLLNIVLKSGLCVWDARADGRGQWPSVAGNVDGNASSEITIFKFLDTTSGAGLETPGL